MKQLATLAALGYVADFLIKSQIAQLPSGTVLFAYGPFGFEVLHNHNLFLWFHVPDQMLVALSATVLAGVVGAMVYFVSKQNIPAATALLVIFLGGLSNLSDRFTLGSTVDYIKLGSLVGNIADIMIIVGVILLLVITREQKETYAS